ncbi:alcohol dehydrogenase (quinone), cytochrome c subunit [Cupriavidus metallidurans]|uniref:c-type cytochrome n=1 Tax=Cupriavidus TaxID=106589 RepID=UPI0004938878|nr:cytochrome c [Cupriavidus metallidurans]AVA37905.1 alcohol dehydrogenase [Cupriavidus metallidurans]KWW37440.1 Gluconate 2-dehydrogenase cytochrome c subunit [Cupriavidus metallidurans]MDE4918903.1 cytochrome c [Cupriavidus metallidurans]
MKASKKATMMVAASALLAASAWTIGAFADDRQGDSATAVQASGADAQLVERGRYLATVADCAACHTAKNGKPFAGGLGIESPIGRIYSTNITPDKSSGIGKFSYDDFDRAVRHGIARDGSTLYPAMPYASYAKVKPSDMQALYAYFMHGVQPIERANKATDIPWPLSMRWPLRFWRMAFAPEVATDDPPVSNDPVARGRYLVEGLAHCGACHTPRGWGLQEKALSDDGKTYLSGGVIDNFLAKNLRGDRKDGLGTWTQDEIFAFLKSGRTKHSAAFGGMSEVVENSMQHVNDADLTAIAAYLKTLTPVNPSAAVLTANASATDKLRAGTDRSNGALTFVDNCAACHRTSGSGYESTFPRIALSSTVNSNDPTSLIHIVLMGGEMPWTKTGPTHYGMPGFAKRLTDRDIADVLTFVRTSWGNQAPPVSAEQVAKVRKSVGAASQPKRPENN